MSPAEKQRANQFAQAAEIQPLPAPSSAEGHLRIFAPEPTCEETTESHRVCPICNHDNRLIPAVKYSREDWRLKECTDCQFVYLENALSYQDLKESRFAWTNTHNRETETRRQEEPVLYSLSTAWKKWRRRYLHRDKGLELLTRFVPKGRVLDIGCSYGMLLQRLPTCSIPYGVEIESAIAESANQVAEPRGGRVVNSDAIRGLESFESGHFSGVTMISFLEHEIRPRELLLQTRRVLCDDGRVVIKVPNYGSWNRFVRGRRWCGFRFPDHVNYFTPSSLSEIVASTGFQVLRCNWFDRLPISDSLWMVASARV